MDVDDRVIDWAREDASHDHDTPDTCRQCDGEGFVGAVRCSWCRCVNCGAPAPGLCRDCAEDDWIDMQEERR